MAIEIAPVAPTPTAMRQSDASSRTEDKEQPQGGNHSVPKPKAGFMAILAATDVNLSDLQDQSTAKRDDAETDLQANSLTDLSALSTNSAMGLLGGEGKDKPEPSVDLPADLALLVGMQHALTGGRTASAGDGGGAFKNAPSVDATGVSGVDVGGAGGGRKLGKLAKDSFSAGESASAKAAGGDASPLQALAQEKDAKITFQMQSASTAAKIAETTPVPLVLAPTLEQHSAEKAIFKPTGSENTPVPPATNFTNTGSFDLSTSAGVDGANKVDAFVAEQVSYWITQDVQKAEMTLDGLGKEPVEVSIRMHGNEAHVSFRTDELQTRDALEHAGSHLKEMLAQQGVQLAGVSVGTSGQSGDRAPQERRPATGVVQVVMGAEQAASTSQGAASRLAGVGRALDLFV